MRLPPICMGMLMQRQRCVDWCDQYQRRVDTVVSISVKVRLVLLITADDDEEMRSNTWCNYHQWIPISMKCWWYNDMMISTRDELILMLLITVMLRIMLLITDVMMRRRCNYYQYVYVYWCRDVDVLLIWSLPEKSWHCCCLTSVKMLIIHTQTTTMMILTTRYESLENNVEIWG